MFEEEANESVVARDAGAKQQVTPKLLQILPSPAPRLELE
jgi:hypothetical protein